MADPLTILGAIASVIQISSAVVDLIKTIKDATSDRTKLLAEIHATTAVCRTLHDSAENNAVPWMETFQILCEGSNGPLHQFRANLEFIKNKLAPGQGEIPGRQPRVDESNITRRMKALILSAKWPFTKDELRATLADMERQKLLFNIALSNDSLRLAAKIHEEVDHITKGVDTIRSNQDNEQRRRSIARLSTIEFDATHNDISISRAKGTGDWFLDSPSFRNWVQSSSNAVLWCYGIPGAGKTTMSSLMIDHLRALQDDSVSIGVAGIYCTYKEPQTIANLLGSLLQQLAEWLGELPQSLSGERPLSPKEIFTALSEVLTKYGKVFLVIDALDECTSATDLSQEIQKLCKSASRSNLRIVATSRTGITDVERNLKADMQLEIRSDEDDVRLYLKESLHDQVRLAKWVSESDGFESLVIESILPRLSGMFLLARLYVDLLVQMPTKRDARKALKTLPEGTDAIYEEAWNRICAQKRYQADMGKKVISWIVCATRGLRLPELRHALAVQEGDTDLDPEGLPDDDSLTSFCAGLVIIDKQSNRISLVHPTAYEYFVKRQQDLIPTGHDLIAVSCTTYLLMDPFRGACLEPDDFVKRYHQNLLGYAAVNWGSHFRSSSSETCFNLARHLLQSDDLRSAAGQALVLNTLEASEMSPEWPVLSSAETRRCQNWSRCKFENSTKSIDALHLASYFGLVELARTLTSNLNGIDKLGMGASAIHWAVLGGQTTMLEVLLQWGASVSISQKSFRFRRWTEWNDNIWDHADCCHPIHLASLLCNVVAIETLLRHGADMNQAFGHRYAQSAGSAAFRNNYMYMEAARSLLASGADVNKNSYIFGHLASCDDQLRKTIISGACKSTLNRALVAAADKCEYEVFTMLIDADVDVDGWAYDDSTPGHNDVENFQYLATHNNDDEKHTTIIDQGEEHQMLRTEEAAEDNDGACEFYETPLIYVVAHDRRFENAKMKACADLLLDSGANVNRVGARSYFYASEVENMVRSDESGFDRWENKTSPLHTAVYYRNLDMIEFLVEKGADVNLIINDSYVPLKSALDSEIYGKPIIDEVDSADGAVPGTTSFEVKAVFQLLLSLGANLDLCLPNDRPRIKKLMLLSPKAYRNFCTLQRLAVEDIYGRPHGISFEDRRTQLRNVLQYGADAEICYEREQQRIRDLLSWTDEKINELDRKLPDYGFIPTLEDSDFEELIAFDSVSKESAVSDPEEVRNHLV